MGSSKRFSLSLLERLAPRGAEDFITEAFCWILQHEGVGNAFLEFLIEEQAQEDRHRTIISGIREGKCSWSTQESRRISSGVKRPDMICESESGKWALIFEHKTESPLGGNQLENYQQVGKKEYGDDKFAIILITAWLYQKGQPDLHFLWRNVHSWLEEWLCKQFPDSAPNTDADEANLEFVCHNFLTLLEKRGLGPMRRIKKDEHLPAIHVGKEAIEIIKEQMQAAQYRWESKTDFEMLNTPKKRNKEGRIGFSVLEDWRPSIFIGVLHDGGDHAVKLLDEKTSPDACVILDMDKEKYPQYRNDPHYIQLADRLTEEWPADGSAGWRAYRLDAPKDNPWHPLHIRRKLADILPDGESGEEQVEAFVEAVKEVVESIVGPEDFWKLREDLANGK